MPGAAGRRRHPGAGRLADRGDRGAGTVLVAMTCVVVAAATVVGLWVAGWVACRHRAAHAADLAALAGAQAQVRGADACPAARVRAADNGARLVACRLEGDRRTFAVRVTAETELLPRVGGRERRVHVDSVAGSLHPR